MESERLRTLRDTALFKKANNAQNEVLYTSEI